MSVLVREDPTKLWLPTLKKEIIRPWFLPSPQSIRDQNELLSNVFFLVRQGDAFGERLRCTRCNVRHDYVTLMCIERPFNGLTQGLYAYYRTIGDNGLERFLNPAERGRFNTLKSLWGGMPDFSSSHPQLAKQQTQTGRLGPSDVQLSAVALGVLEGIAAVHAAKLVERINDRGLRPKLVLEAASGTQVYR